MYRIGGYCVPMTVIIWLHALMVWTTELKNVAQWCGQKKCFKNCEIFGNLHVKKSAYSSAIGIMRCNV
jgi:hypothetical protein